jgi:hypothetical protein
MFWFRADFGGAAALAGRDSAPLPPAPDRLPFCSVFLLVLFKASA